MHLISATTLGSEGVRQDRHRIAPMASKTSVSLIVQPCQSPMYCRYFSDHLLAQVLLFLVEVYGSYRTGLGATAPPSGPEWRLQRSASNPGKARWMQSDLGSA